MSNASKIATRTARGAPSWLVAASTLALVAGGCLDSESQDEGESDPVATLDLPSRDSVSGLCGGERCDAVLRGAVTFFDRKLHGLEGNGRACVDCHMATDHFQLSPANAEARFRILAWRRQLNPDADDPLFRPIDADDFRTNGASATDFSNLRENGLIRIVFPLPPNIKLIDPMTNEPSSETLVDVWRAVPTVDNVKLTGPDPNPPSWFRPPNANGGYQHDARFATLQEQALGAFVNHAEVKVQPPQRMLDDLTAFQRVLFSSAGVRASSAAIDRGVTPPPDPDPLLDALEQQGKIVFNRACAQCHAGVGGTLPGPGIDRFGGIQTQCPRPVDFMVPPRWQFATCPPRLARNARTYEITTPTGAKLRRTSSDPGRTLLTGFAGGPPPFDDWNALDVPSTRGIGKTAPYFHNNSAATLEEVLDHYTEFFKFVAAISPPPPVPAPPLLSTDGVHIDRPFTPSERAALLAYLRRL
jgi:hypothetical protein